MQTNILTLKRSRGILCTCSPPTVAASAPIQSYQADFRRRLFCPRHPYDTDGDMSIILNEEKEAIKIGANGTDYPGKRQDFWILSK